MVIVVHLINDKRLAFSHLAETRGAELQVVVQSGDGNTTTIHDGDAGAARGPVPHKGAEILTASLGHVTNAVASLDDRLQQAGVCLYLELALMALLSCNCVHTFGTHIPGVTNITRFCILLQY